MTQEQLDLMKNGQGFIAALDQSGGSTPKALAAYGVGSDQYANETEMFDLVHQMRTRIMTSPAFTSEKILGTILFEQTMDRKVDGKYTADYLLDKGILPFLKVDKGLAPEHNGVQLMKNISNLDTLLDRAVERHIFGTKMRSNILGYDEGAISAVIDQQFGIGQQIIAKGLVPILEPEVNINAPDKDKIEAYMAEEIKKHLDDLDEGQVIMLKVTIPTTPNRYQELAEDPRVLRVVALSGGYPLDEACDKLSQNKDMIASFSRALIGDLRVDQSDDEFNEKLQTAVDKIYKASVEKK